jgi:hypothetical protein
MWRFSAFVLFLALIFSAGRRDAWRETFSEVRGFVLSCAQYSLSVAESGGVAPGPSAPASGLQESRGQNSGDPGTGAHEEGVKTVSQASPSAAVASPPQLQIAKSMVASQEEKGLETRDVASHIPLSIRTNEVEIVATTPDGPSGPRLAAEMQAELARLGCYDGPRDNVWGSSSGKAVRRLNKVATLRLRSAEPSVEALDALKDIGEPLCRPPRGRTDNGGDSLKREDTPKGEKTPQWTKIQDRLPGQISPAAVGLQAGTAKQASEPSGSYLPPWMQGSQTANAQADASPDGRAVDGSRSSANKKSGSSHLVRAARAQREHRVRQRQRQQRPASSWFSFFN